MSIATPPETFASVAAAHAETDAQMSLDWSTPTRTKPNDRALSVTSVSNRWRTGSASPSKTPSAPPPGTLVSEVNKKNHCLLAILSTSLLLIVIVKNCETIEVSKLKIVGII